ncbi:hypothetical protein INT47_004573 [Mucor saturninus]|uniref:WRKY domain-containing protein n=1 Tax=Mucor saturninus TaxID=64648 RepID=A0A8H7RIR1_9FUNG|nr:hypothetical protein INT47_004573 [Mucor saturninus]
MPSIHESTNTPLYDLQEVIQQYQSQPELLKLILTSKVEEDKRRAEEAKLRAKELDMYLQHNQTPNSPPTTPRLSVSDVAESPKKLNTTGKILPSLSLPSSVSSSSSLKKNHRGSPYVIPNSTTFRSYHSSISSASSISSLSDEDIDEDDEELPNVDHHQQRRHSAAAAMLAMGKSLAQEEKSEPITSAYPSPIADNYNDEHEDFAGNKPRRRREMQAITKIVETREFPYVDNYFWKNNGNTVQKKTGCKSIYYKCSNSNKGCSVNKTVTARPNGEYLIKYRGCHLPECGRVERIRDL